MGIIKKIKNLFSPERRLSEDEKLVYKVVVKLLNYPGSQFKHAPLSLDVLVCNKEKGYSLLVNSNKVKLTNHKFSLEKSFSISFVELLKEKLYAKMEEEKQQEIKEIFARDTELINEMSKNLD